MTWPIPLSDAQHDQLRAYEALLWDANQRVNLFARTTPREVLYPRHIAHSLTLLVREFAPGSDLVDFGTGGGLPGIPLAIARPDLAFTLVDSTRKKVDAVQAIARDLGLTNVDVWWGRAEVWTGTADYAVSRATAPLRDLWAWFRRARTASPLHPQGCWAPGLLCLKGGDLTAELRDAHKAYPALHIATYDLAEQTGDALFNEKVLLHVIAPGG